MFKVGDKIKVLDDNQQGVVVQILKHGTVVLNENGFEEVYDKAELIHHEELIINDFELVAETKTSKNKTQLKDEPREIDLHIGHLVDYTSGMTNFEMLQIQLDRVRAEIALAKKEKRNRLIFIHGHGSGKLRDELHQLLNSYAKLEFYDASFRKYKLGATEVRLF